MTSPMLTVVVLAVLWLIVVVPMVLRRKDEGAGERSVSRFGSAMRALSTRVSPGSALASGPAPHEPEVHVPGGNRKPVPASKESLMYAPDRHEMSEARRAMMARRRRSLTGLGGGSGIFLLVAIVLGGPAWWTLATLFLLALGGYVLFLRTQAQRDRDRRESRLRRSSTLVTADGYDVTEPRPARVVPDNAVRIDDDDVHLDHIDTVDLTGLYRDDRAAAGEALPAAATTSGGAVASASASGGADEDAEPMRRAG